MEEQSATWIHPGRITDIEATRQGRRRVTIDCGGVTFAARGLEGREAIRDLVLQGRISNVDTGEEIYVVELEALPEYVRVGMAVMVQVDEEDEFVIHLYPDALYREPDLPPVMRLVCPEEQRGRWFRLVEGSVYECRCGVRWDVLVNPSDP